ncbi:MAG TPA: HAD family hydrolase [Candidatus Methylomirabilis sp.]|nr:HAD family hydrolase [Candidatus Methylomirabilis sp.]
MQRISCRALLFDLDGVLVDSTPAVTRVWTAWSLKHGFDPDEVVRMAHGRTSLSTIVELLPNADHAAEDRDVERREIEDVDGVIPLPGAAEILRKLSADRWAVVTSATHALAEVRIHAAGLPVPKHLITASDITRSKPDPEPYLLGAKSVGYAPGECIVIEDAPSGIRSAKSAGARVIALRTTAPDAELAAAGADWITPDLRSLSLANNAKGDKLFLCLDSYS